MSIMNKIKFTRFRGVVREFEQTLTEAGYSDAVFYPAGLQGLFVAVKPTAGEAQVQYTYSSIADVKAGTAEWVDLWNDTVTSYKDDQIFPCTAIRMQNVSGITKMFGGSR